MKFNRGKTFYDPIYLKKPKGEYWMEGDIYMALCQCLKQIFKKNFTVTSFKTKQERFLSGQEYTVCTVQDGDGDTHTFVATVVDHMPWEKDTSSSDSPWVHKDSLTDETDSPWVHKDSRTNETDSPWVRSDNTTAMTSPGIKIVKSDTKIYAPKLMVGQTNISESIDESETNSENVVEDFDKIKADIKQEIDIEKFNQEMEEEKSLTNENDSDKLPTKKHVKLTRKTKKQ